MSDSRRQPVCTSTTCHHCAHCGHARQYHEAAYGGGCYFDSICGCKGYAPQEGL